MRKVHPSRRSCHVPRGASTRLSPEQRPLANWSSASCGPTARCAGAGRGGGAASTPTASLVRFSGVTTDITERKEAETARRCWPAKSITAPRTRWPWCRPSCAWRGATTSTNYIKAVEGRIGALAQTHELAVAVALGRRRYPAPGAGRAGALSGRRPPARHARSGPRWCWRRNKPSWWPWRCMNWPPMPPNMARSRVGCGRVDVSWSSFEGTLALMLAGSRRPAVSAPARKGLRHQDHHQPERQPIAGAATWFRLAPGWPDLHAGADADRRRKPRRRHAGIRCGQGPARRAPAAGRGRSCWWACSCRNCWTSIGFRSTEPIRTAGRCPGGGQSASASTARCWT